MSDPIREPVPIEDILKGDIYPSFSTRRGERPEAKSFRSHLSVEEIARLLTARVKELVPQFEAIGYITIHGTLRGRDTNITLNVADRTMSYVERDGESLFFSAEKKDYQRGTEQTKVTTPSHDYLEGARKFLDDLARKAKPRKIG